MILEKESARILAQSWNSPFLIRDKEVLLFCRVTNIKINFRDEDVKIVYIVN